MWRKTPINSTQVYMLTIATISKNIFELEHHLRECSLEKAATFQLLNRKDVSRHLPQNAGENMSYEKVSCDVWFWARKCVHVFCEINQGLCTEKWPNCYVQNVNNKPATPPGDCPSNFKLRPSKTPTVRRSRWLLYERAMSSSPLSVALWKYRNIYDKTLCKNG